jgi:hypothetical protein
MPRRGRLSLFGALGALAPDVLIVYSKRWTEPALAFDPWQYAVALLVYVLLAAIVAAIFPYRGGARNWKAFAVGVTLPVIVAGLLAIPLAAVPMPRGVDGLPGSVLDLMALF